MKPAPALLQAGERLLVDETKLDLAQLRVDPANEREELVTGFHRQPSRGGRPLREIGEPEARAIDEAAQAVQVRREMEAIFRQEWGFGSTYRGAAVSY